jgi:hypothetical protein
MKDMNVTQVSYHTYDAGAKFRLFQCLPSSVVSKYDKLNSYKMPKHLYPFETSDPNWIINVIKAQIILNTNHQWNIQFSTV